MRRTKNLIVLIVILGILVGSYFFLAGRPGPESPQGEDGKISIFSFDKDEILQMELKNESGQLSFKREEKEVKVEKDGKEETVKKGVWEIDYPYDIALREVRIDDLAYTFAGLDAERIIEEEAPEDLSPYGLDKPQAEGKAYLKDGSEKILYLGDKTPIGSTFYLMVEGDSKVYEVWGNHGDHLLYNLSDLRDRSLPFVDAQRMTYLLIDKKDGRPVELVINDGKDDEEDIQLGLSMWRLSKPYKELMGVDSEAIANFIEDFPDLSISDFIEDGAEDLSKYGLSEPSTELILKDDVTGIHLLFGKEYEDGMIYFKLSDSDSVYGMKKSGIDFLNIKPYDLAEKFAFIVSIDFVDKIVVEGKGQTHTLSMTRKTEPGQDGEEDEVITTYKLDDKEVEEKPFKSVYQSIIGIYVDGETSVDIPENSEIKTTFYLNKGKDREVHINYVPYDNDFYAVFRGGEAEFAVNKAAVQKVFEEIESLMGDN